MDNETLPTPDVPHNETGSKADKFVDWHLKNAPQPWTAGHTKSYLRSLVERDIYNKVCSIEAAIRVQGSEVHASQAPTGSGSQSDDPFSKSNRPKSLRQAATSASPQTSEAAKEATELIYQRVRGWCMPHNRKSQEWSCIESDIQSAIDAAHLLLVKRLEKQSSEMSAMNERWLKLHALLGTEPSDDWDNAPFNKILKLIFDAAARVEPTKDSQRLNWLQENWLLFVDPYDRKQRTNLRGAIDEGVNASCAPKTQEDTKDLGLR